MSKDNLQQDKSRGSRVDAHTQGHARWAEPVQLDEREEAMPLQVLVLFPLASFVQVFFAWHFSEPLADLHCRGRGS